eukprot:4278822-Amphidinium_carterae.1
MSPSSTVFTKSSAKFGSGRESPAVSRFSPLGHGTDVGCWVLLVVVLKLVCSGVGLERHG